MRSVDKGANFGLEIAGNGALRFFFAGRSGLNPESFVGLSARAARAKEGKGRSAGC